MLTKRTLLKSELARKLHISTQTLYRFMNDHEEGIKAVYPAYNRRSKILYPKVIDFIIYEMGYSYEEIYSN